MTEIPKVEQVYVIDIYNKISVEFSSTRYKVWDSVKSFLTGLTPNSKVLEIGCGNGKNMSYRKDINMYGIDVCASFVEMCKNKNLKVCYGSGTDIPFESSSFDAVLSIAVIHHLSTIDRRKQCVREMLRVCKENGAVMIEVWDVNTDPDKDNNGDNDYLVPFKKLGNRFYHLFNETEFKDLVLVTYDNYKLEGRYYNERENWIFIGTKTKIV